MLPGSFPLKSFNEAAPGAGAELGRSSRAPQTPAPGAAVEFALSCLQFCCLCPSPSGAAGLAEFWQGEQAVKLLFAFCSCFRSCSLLSSNGRSQTLTSL